MIIANIVTFILVSLGALNWGLIGIFNWNFVTAIFGPGLTVGAVIVYIVIFVASLWLIGYAIYSRGKIDMNINRDIRKSK